MIHDCDAHLTAPSVGSTGGLHISLHGFLVVLFLTRLSRAAVACSPTSTLDNAPQITLRIGPANHVSLGHHLALHLIATFPGELSACARHASCDCHLQEEDFRDKQTIIPRKSLTEPAVAVGLRDQNTQNPPPC